VLLRDGTRHRSGDQRQNRPPRRVSGRGARRGPRRARGGSRAHPPEGDPPRRPPPRSAAVRERRHSRGAS
jgi:hypothetical protein